MIVAAVRDRENEGLLRQSGADQVVVSSDAAGQLFGISTIRPSAARVIADLLDSGCWLDLDEREVGQAEVGHPAREAAGAVIAVTAAGGCWPPMTRRLRGCRPVTA